MAWKKGQSGNPVGRPRKRLISHEIEKELMLAHESGDKTKARVIAEKVVELAVSGTPWAVHFVAERIEGAPDQHVSIIREVRELSDGELANIATGSGEGVIGETDSSQVTSSVH